MSARTNSDRHEGEFITFQKQERIPGRKTDKWSVTGNQSRTDLGTIEWFTAWRRYVFVPVYHTIFDMKCLDEISGYLEDRMADWRGGP